MTSQRRVFIASVIWMLLLPPLALLAFWHLPVWGVALVPIALTVPVWLILRESPLGIFLDLSVASLFPIFTFLLFIGLFGKEDAYLAGAIAWAASPFLGWLALRSGVANETASGNTKKAANSDNFKTS